MVETVKIIRKKPGNNASARGCALDALVAVLEPSHTGSDEALERAAGFLTLDARDRAFARQMVMTALRRLGQIDGLLAHCMEKSLPPRLAPVRAALRLGVAQLIWLNTPPHAAVHAMVDLVAERGFGGHKALVNAILNRIVREGRELTHQQDEGRINLSFWLWERLVRDWGEDAARRIACAQLAEPRLDVTLAPKQNAAHWAQELNADILPSGTLRLREASGRVDALAGFAEGAWWVQDAAAALPARLLGDVGGKNVADLCAAPGGKTAQLAAAGGQVTAVDQSAARLRRVKTNMQRLKLSAEIVEADLLEWTPAQEFSAILLDAPCMALGTLRRHPEAGWVKRPADIKRMVALQRELLDKAISILAPGGVLVYTVCSLLKEEGEGQITQCLERHDALTLDAVRAEEIGGMAQCITPLGELRTLPFHLEEQGGMDGFYAARLVKRG